MTAYADPELMIADWLRDTLEIKVWRDPKLPGNETFTAPFTHVQRGAGLGSAPLSLDDVTLDVDVYAAAADKARDTAGRIWTAIVFHLPLTTFDNGIFCKFTSAITPPMWGPDPTVYRRTAAYRIVLHGVV